MRKPKNIAASAAADDGLVLIQGELVEPIIVQLAAQKKFLRWDGRAPQALVKRYSANYPHPDATTPSFAEFKLLMGRRATPSADQRGTL